MKVTCAGWAGSSAGVGGGAGATGCCIGGGAGVAVMAGEGFLRWRCVWAQSSMVESAQAVAAKRIVA